MISVIKFSLAVACMLVSLLAVSLREQYFSLPIHELKRRAARGHQQPKSLYRVAAYGTSLQLLLWLIIGLFSAASFVLFARLAPAWLGFGVIAISLWLTFSWLPGARGNALTARLAMSVTPGLAWLLNYLHPALDRLGALFGHHRIASRHTGLYEQEDLLKLFEQQASQTDSRLAKDELDRARRGITFSSYKVRDLLTERRKVKMVAPADAITPVFASELHDSGHACFPVYDKHTKTVVGILSLGAVSDIARVKRGGTVADMMVAVAHLHENDGLEELLDTFYKTKQQLFVVVNGFEEYVGIITLEDALRVLAGQLQSQSFDQHHDRTAVAHKHDSPQEATTTVETQPVTRSEDLEIVEIDGEPVARRLATKEVQSQAVEKLSETEETVVE